MTVARAVAGVVLVASLAACTGEDGSAEPPAPSPTAAAPVAPAPSPPPTQTGPELLARPDGDIGLWLDTIGVPVAAAVRTSAPLAALVEATPELRAATCRQVATELDAIADPQVLTGLAITADPETATLLTADLDAKADLLAACVAGGQELDELVEEVAFTHGVAVAWLGVLAGSGT